MFGRRNAQIQGRVQWKSTRSIVAAQIAQIERWALKHGRSNRGGRWNIEQSVEGVEAAYVADATISENTENDGDVVGVSKSADANGEDSPDGGSGGGIGNGGDYNGGADAPNWLDDADREDRIHNADGADAAFGADGVDGTGVTGGGNDENYGDSLGRLVVEDSSNCLKS